LAVPQYNAIIVDDKWLFRSELKYMLREYPSINIVGEAGNTAEAMDLISEQKPDVIFLDIQMPGFSGFDLLDKIDSEFKVIFISSYKQYQETALKYNPVDFLLKPINSRKLSKTIQKLQESFAHSA
jgi:two-component system LytT family response regulator